MLIPATLPTLLLEKTTAGLRERERPHEGVPLKPSAPSTNAHRTARLARRSQTAVNVGLRVARSAPTPNYGHDTLEPTPTRDQVRRSNSPKPSSSPISRRAARSVVAG